jgi:hypothetical protein
VSTLLAREARSQTSRPTWRTSFRERLDGVQGGRVVPDWHYGTVVGVKAKALVGYL